MSEKEQRRYYVYLIQSASGAVKIGISYDPRSRLATLQTGNHEKLAMVYGLEVRTQRIAKALESVLHERYRKHQLTNEWYRVSPDEIIADIRFATAFARVVKEVVIFTDIDKPEVAPIPPTHQIQFYRK